MPLERQTRATKNRLVRQEALRDQLSKQKHLEHAIGLAKKLSDQALTIDKNMVNRYKIAIATHLKLLDKYLPDLKSTEIIGGDGEPLSIQLTLYAKPDELDAMAESTKQADSSPGNQGDTVDGIVIEQGDH